MNPFIFVRSDALQDQQLLKSPSVFMTLCAISTMTTREKNGSCYFRQSTIAKLLNKTRQAVSRDLNKLKELGYLEIIEQSYGGRQSNNKYKILYDTPLNETVQRDVAAVQRDVAHAVQRDVAPKCLNINTKKEKPLTREIFLLELNRRLKEGYFEGIIDKDLESYLNIIGNNAFDHWEGYGFPSRDPYPAFKGYLRRARADDKLTRHIKDNTSKATKESPEHSQWRARCSGYLKGLQWQSIWGAEPDQPETRVPQAVLKDFDFTNQPEEELQNA